MAKDPVCGMQVEERQAKATSQHSGQTMYFCSPGCKEKFEQDPERYARQSA
jgi:YHS domain-containing protein